MLQHSAARLSRAQIARFAAALTVTALALPVFAPGAQPAPRPAPGSASRPTLVLLIAVDQLRPDYFDRWQTQLVGGLARLRHSSAYFANGRQNHALTETAPGHSTMLSGRWPAHTNIYANDAGVPDDGAPLIAGATKQGASPRRFMGTALYDWMRTRDTSTRQLSVSRKDRGAILPVGRGGSDVYWWANGRFTTSSYYRTELPSWLTEWNGTFDLASFAGRTWSLQLPESAYNEIDDRSYENNGKELVFPHVLTSDRALLTDKLERAPWMDSLILDVALRGVRATGVGQREGHTDLLTISLSTTDAVGHDFGPDSREVHDHVLKLDRWLGDFLDALQAIVPASRTVVVLTADHGVSAMPESDAGRAVNARRLNLVGLADSLGHHFRARYGVDFGFGFDNGLLVADTDALRARGVNVAALASRVAARVKRIDGVSAVFTPSSLPQSTSTMAGLWRRSLPPRLGWLIAASTRPGVIFSDGKRAEHGTNHAETMRVPILFSGAGIRAASHSRPIDTVDIAPTLAAYLGLTPSERLDGRVLPEVVKARR